MNPLGAVLLFFFIVLIFAVPRQWVLLTFLAGALYMAEEQATYVMGVNVFSLRFLELALFLRVMSRGELATLRLNAIDKTFLALFTYTTIVYLLRAKDGQAYQIGLAVDAWLVYFPCRTLINDIEDVRSLLKGMAVLLAPYTLLVLAESHRGRSPLAFLGWGASDVASWMRNGRIRCFGSFRHPSLLGTLAVSFVPLYIGMAFRRTDRKTAVIAILLLLAIVWAANSGGPIGGVAAGLAGWMLWKFKVNMRLFRWGLIGMFVCAALFMKAPVWYLPMHFSNVSGGDGYHRSRLMEACFDDFPKWWLAGMSRLQTLNWFPYLNPATGGADITNQFIVFALAGGLGSLILFITLLVQGFKAVGKALASVRANPAESPDVEPILWGMGCMLGAHCVNWIGISYFDQTYAFWYFELAAISSICGFKSGSQDLPHDQPEIEIEEMDRKTLQPAPTVR